MNYNETGMRKIANLYNGMQEFIKDIKMNEQELKELYYYSLNNIINVINSHKQKEVIDGVVFLNKFYLAFYVINYRDTMIETWNSYIKNNDIKNMKKLISILNCNDCTVKVFDDLNKNYISVYKNNIIFS